jgi:anti-anti-sigma factor
MDDSQVTLTEVGDVRVIGLPTDVGAATEEPLLPIVRDALESSPRLIIVDFTGVETTNSAGVGLLFDLVRRGREQNIPVALANVTAQPKLVLERVQLPRYAVVFDSVEAAIESVREGREEGGS